MILEANLSCNEDAVVYSKTVYKLHKCIPYATTIRVIENLLINENKTPYTPATCIFHDALQQEKCDMSVIFIPFLGSIAFSLYMEYYGKGHYV